MAVALTLVVLTTASAAALNVGNHAQSGCGSSSLAANKWISAEIATYGRSCEYKFNGRAGATVSIAMVRTPNSAIDPWLDLLDPAGMRVASNDNGYSPTGIDSLISRYRLARTGTYRIVARDRTGAQTGGFQIRLQY
jgi:hypothetical protein